MNFVTIPVCCGLASRGLYCGTYDVFGKFVEYGYTHCWIYNARNMWRAFEATWISISVRWPGEAVFFF